jgi:Ca2+-binding RTX toxin-like protein
MDGGDGNDKGIGGFGHDTLIGGLGDDTLEGSEAPDNLFGGDGNDTLDGGSGGDEIHGGNGDDTISSDTGPDRIDAGPGDDVIHLNSDPPSHVASIDCGDGYDTVYNSPAPMGRTNRKLLAKQPNCENVIDLAAERDPTRGVSWQGNGTKHGSERNDRLNGQHGSGKIYGNGGDDVIWGDAAHDSGGARALKQKDFLSGGAGDDTIYAGRGTTTALGGDGNDFMQGNGQRAVLSGGPGADTIRVAGKNTSADGGEGDDTITAIIASGRGSVKCGPGNDTVLVSRFAGNRKRVSVAADCEKKVKG